MNACSMCKSKHAWARACAHVCTLPRMRAHMCTCTGVCESAHENWQAIGKGQKIALKRTERGSEMDFLLLVCMSLLLVTAGILGELNLHSWATINTISVKIQQPFQPDKTYEPIFPQSNPWKGLTLNNCSKNCPKASLLTMNDAQPWRLVHSRHIFKCRLWATICHIRQQCPHQI